MPTSGLVFYAPLAEYKTTSETGQNLSYYNADASNFTTKDGIECFDCSTATRRVLSDTISMTLGSEYTMSVWCNIATLTNFPRGMCFGNDTDNKSLTTPDFWIGTWDFCVGGYGTDVRTGHYGEANTWYHCVQTFNHGICKLYLDGVLIYTSSSLSITVDNAIVSFGAATTYTSNNYLRGYVACGRLYERVLTDEEIAILATELKPLLEPVFNNQRVTFYGDAGATSKQLRFDNKGRAYSFQITAGTLPTGVTFNGSTGTFSYDGTTISQDQDYSLTVTMTGDWLATTTAAITLNMKVEAQAVPTGYVFYMPMTSMSGFEASDPNVTVQDYSSSYPVEFTTQNGIDCAYCYGTPNRSIKIDNVTNSFPFGETPRTVSFWVKYANSNYTAVRTFFAEGQDMYGSPTGNGKAYDIQNSYEDNGIVVLTMASTANAVTSGSLVASLIQDQNWHHICLTSYNNQSNILQAEMYLDGVLAYQAIGTLSMNTATYYSFSAIGGYSHMTGHWNYTMNGYIAGFRLYDRVLTSAEIQALASELTPLA